MENTFTVIQDTWNEEDDIELLNYVADKNLKTKYLSENEILNTNITNIDVLFCDTDIIQKKIKSELVPDCYPLQFQTLYNRNIQKIKLKNLNDIQKPYFVKPFENNKSFDARRIYNDENHKYLLEDLSELNFKEDDYLYICTIVEFVNEFRLFIGNKKIYGVVESTDILINSKKSVSIKPPEDFLDKILQLNTFNFCVIDIGIINFNGSHVWSIVEVNPPFALSSYKWPIDNYYKYCKDAFNYLKN
tara:strand:+ start:314 stop:1051 length:738 start_codon:yes stop_codon:yes gene_type:complete